MTAIKRAKRRFSRHFHAKAMYRMVWGDWSEQPKRLFVSLAMLGGALCQSRAIDPHNYVLDAECIWQA